MKQPILFMFGGISAEHEVSVVTGLQALEHVDVARYELFPVYVTKQGEFLYIPKLASRKEFLTAKRISVSFGRNAKGGFMKTNGLISKKFYPYAAYLAFHGGLGESGTVQGLLESVGIPHTGSSTEGAVIAMNKKLTKEALTASGVATVPDIRFFAEDVRANVETLAARAIEEVGLPAIIKPVHLGSSIGLTIARNEVELQKGLLEAAFSDTEMIVEPFLEGISEFNCAVRSVNGTLEASEVERPISHDAILSFADKYERGGKKSGAGMASLARELPAKISPTLKEQIQNAACIAFSAARLRGMARIDFMQDATGMLYLTEINPIPGSMAYYLWEASGIPFQTQIGDMIEEAVSDAKKRAAARLDYHSDIVERFVRGS
jgi:D-alanine-D-alanine ligase